MSDHKSKLLEKISSRTAVVGVVGLGYVGLPLALVFEEAGFPVIGFDIDPKKPEALNRGESYIRHIGPERVAANYPETTREEIVPRLEAKGLKCGNRVVPGVN
jgi:UDP-N-acetyl-D-mannosaminuronate dehydrogenase